MALFYEALVFVCALLAVFMLGLFVRQAFPGFLADRRKSRKKT